jgi:hypothetical protein
VDAVTAFRPPDVPLIELAERPRLASWERRDHPDQVRLRAYLKHLSAVVEPAIAAIHGPTALQLNVGLGPDVDLMHQRDLDNFLQPIAEVLPSSVCSYWATKSTAPTSSVSVGPAVVATDADFEGWQCASADSSAAAGSTVWKTAINAAIARAAIPAPDGPVELQVTFAVGAARRWLELWKPAIDSLDAILGRTRPDRPFHRRDDRVVRLALHRNIDPNLGRGAAIDVYWRPAIGVDVGVPRSQVRRPTASGRGARLATAASLPAAGEPIAVFQDDDDGYSSWIAANPRGYVVNIARTLRTSEARLHHAHCRTISGANPHGGPWTGPYIKLCSPELDTHGAVQRVPERLVQPSRVAFKLVGDRLGSGACWSNSRWALPAASRRGRSATSDGSVSDGSALSGSAKRTWSGPNFPADFPTAVAGGGKSLQID